MEINTGVPQVIQPLYECLVSREAELTLTGSQMFFDFPVYKELDEGVLVAQTMVLSKSHGVLLFRVSQQTDEASFDSKYKEEINELNKLYSIVFARLLRNDKLKFGRNNTIVPITTFLYAPYLAGQEHPREKFSQEDVFVAFTESQLVDSIIEASRGQQSLSDDSYEELQSTIEGSKGLLVPNLRETVSENTKGYVANMAEREIMLFDRKQKTAYLKPLVGVSRIRGLAGSGKTVILCMKAALLHLSDPNAQILYTFYTKSLYQHVRRLITRFYRQYNDQDPDWEKIQVRHAWGSSNMEGVYSLACSHHGVVKMSFGEARFKSIADPFNVVCKDFMQKVPCPDKLYDYVLIDEGQDFPTSFISLCLSLVKDEKILFAYDDQQTIFQNHAPTSEEIFGKNEDGTPRVSFKSDTVLPKCYRNPREILVVAHALGFGIYSKSISQMIENEEYWHDIGYEIEEGKLVAGNHVSILRPEDNSLKSISQHYSKEKIVRCKVNEEFKDEIIETCQCINDDIKNQNLHPEDIMVLTADDKNASTYLNTIEKTLADRLSIKCNNVHADKFSVGNFQEKGRVTLSTIHKAKGNEAYSVYIVGIDALIPAKKNYRARNLLFTAMTRAKGWVRLSGLGETAQLWANEIQRALDEFPYLRFTYPTEADIKLMKRDMAEASAKENKLNRLIDELLGEMRPEEAKLFIEQRTKNKE